ncbi:MAG: CDP-alcohol phosphatidyltransferase family protein [Clostridia bacterium]|nr:CDP-alcohol phosphatidyltransferase family protein [Clostridia bacterium]
MMNRFKRNIPNYLTAMRILLIPFIIYCFITGRPIVSFALLALSAFTDVADGKIARKYGYITDIGKILDPIADKLTMATVVALLWIKYGHKIPGLTVLLCVLLGKDVLMLIGSSILFNLIKKPLGSVWYGKMSTVIFYASALAIILIDILKTPDPLKSRLIFALIFIAAAAAVIAFICYVGYGIRTLKESRREEAIEKKATV